MKNSVVIIIAKEIRGHCPVYREGDKMILNKYYIESKNSSNICIHALTAMSTLLSAFAHGCSAIDLGIGSDENVGFLQCPDPGICNGGGTVIFEIRKIAD